MVKCLFKNKRSEINSQYVEDTHTTLNDNPNFPTILLYSGLTVIKCKN